MAGALLVLSLLSNVFSTSSVSESQETILQDKIEQGELTYPDAGFTPNTPAQTDPNAGGSAEQ